MAPKILHEDEDILVVDKPSGMVVDRNGTGSVETVQDWITNNFQFPVSNFQSMRNGIVHRIDKETSGVLLIAKTPEAFRELQKQFKKREVEKTYVALVHGRVVPAEGVIRAPLGRLPWNRERFGVLPGGREAETRYKQVCYLRNKTISNVKVQSSNQVQNPNNEFSLLELNPKTGRTHQIRVHLKSIGHPIVGDTFYAGRKTARRDREWCPRLFLHALKITFTHPGTAKRMTVEAPMPEELHKVLNF